MVSYSALGYLSDAASSIIPVKLLSVLIFAKTVAAFELFLPLALFITLLVGLGKLYSEQEISALQAAGVSVLGLVRTLLPLIVIITVLTAIVSLYVRPWAYDLRYTFKYKAEDTHDFERLESGYFYQNEDSGTVYFTHDVDDNLNVKNDVFVRDVVDDAVRVISAEKSYHVKSEESENATVIFLDGTAHQRVDDGVDTVLEFKRLIILPDEKDDTPREFKRKAAATSFLAESEDPEEIAEYQWRVTSAAKAFLLALIAVFLAKTSPRQGRYGKLVLGILLFFIIHGMSLVLRASIEQGNLSTLPGMWIAVIVLSLLTLIMAKKQS